MLDVFLSSLRWLGGGPFSKIHSRIFFRCEASLGSYLLPTHFIGNMYKHYISILFFLGVYLLDFVTLPASLTEGDRVGVIVVEI